MLFWWRSLVKAGLVLLVVSGLLAMAAGFILRSRVLAAVATTQRVATLFEKRNVELGCAHVPEAAVAWNEAASVSRPFAPVLRQLGWMPQIGPELALLPATVELGHNSTSAGAALCDIFTPAFAETSTQARLAALARGLESHHESLADVEAQFHQAHAAWLEIAPHTEETARLRAYSARLHRFGETLPRMIDTVEMAREIGPQLPWLLGLDAPRSFLVVSQNPYELRPTGGFIGIVCRVEVEQARTKVKGCQGSGTYNAPAPDPTAMPFAYRRYLRLGNWYLRDANWSPDFPTSAETLRWFWSLNQQPDVDGVIAADPFAFVPLLEAAGPLKLDDGTIITADRFVDTLLALYYDGTVYSDRARIGGLLPEILKHLEAAPTENLPAIVAALQEGFTGRHLQIVIDQPEAAAFFQRIGWDGRMQSVRSDVLRVVDADVGYGDVNAFVQRLTHYDVSLDDQLAPVTATLTLTYTNTFSPWAEATTPHSVYGRCTDPQTLELGPPSGCYANYLRVYVPRGSQLLDLSGVEDSLGTDLQHGRMVFGGYFRLQPGETRVVQMRYQLPKVEPGRLLIEKQPGTLDLPVLITARSATQQATLWTGGNTDLHVTYAETDGTLKVEGREDPATTALFKQHADYLRGLSAWDTGKHSAAINVWHASMTLDRALDHARYLAKSGRHEEALRLMLTIAEQTTDARASFEAATLYEQMGQLEHADRLYQQAAQRSATHPLAQLTWATRQAAHGQSLSNTIGIEGNFSSAARRWHRMAESLEQMGDLDAALAHLTVLRHVLPQDRAISLRYADVLTKAQQIDTAHAEYMRLSKQDDIWGLLAGARLAQLNQQPLEATALYVQAVPLAVSYEHAMRIGNGLRDLGDSAGALQAYEKAAALNPRGIWPLMAAGHMLRAIDPASARTWYQRAATIDPYSGAPDHALGQLLMDTGDAEGALPYFEAAVSKQPHVASFHESLARVQAQLGLVPLEPITQTP